MMQAEPLQITLLSHPEDAAPPWSPPVLRDQLRQLGHRVEIRRTPEVGCDVVHALGWRAAGFMDAWPGPWVLTPGADTPADAATLVGSASAVLVPSSHHAAAVNQLGVPHFRITVVPVAVDCRTFTRLGPMANRTGRFRVVTRLTDDSDGLVRAIEALRYAPDAELIAVAPDDDENGLPAEADRLATVTGTRSRVAVVHARDAGERAWWLRSAHAALTVSGTVADPQFVVEAMACGTPVVATLVDAQRELVVHGVTGFHVPSGHPKATAGALREIFADEFSLEAYGMAASDRAMSRLDWPHVAHDLAAAYRRVLMPSADGGGAEEDGGSSEQVVASSV
jgi:glycosyltransferase involved in cell wall biosynthesis